MRSFSIMILLSLLIACGTAVRAQQPRFPDITGWTKTLGETVYTPDNLWDFIDGAAEAYNSFGFVELTLAEYIDSESTDVRVEVYLHRSPDHAFGIYSQERNPSYNFFQIGTQGYTEEGVLNFLCGTYYVKITSHAVGSRGMMAMRIVGEQIAAALDQPRGWPKALNHFPKDHKVRNGETFIAENFLGYSFLKDVFLAEYDGTPSYRLFLVPHASEAAAEATIAAYAKSLGIDSVRVGDTDRVAQWLDPHNGMIYLQRIGAMVCGSVGQKDAAVAATAFGTIRNSLLNAK